MMCAADTNAQARHDSRPARVLVFAGDSITAAGRDTRRPLGDGFVTLIADRMQRGAASIVNVGVNGDRARDLTTRWERDVTPAGAAIVTVLIGVNETLRRYDAGDPTSTAAFRQDLQAVIDRTYTSTPHIVVMEPFLAPVSPSQSAWRDDDLADKAAVVADLAGVTGALFVPLQDRIDRLVASVGVEVAVPDGIHPNAAGHAVIAEAWWDAVHAEHRFASIL